MNDDQSLSTYKLGENMVVQLVANW